MLQDTCIACCFRFAEERGLAALLLVREREGEFHEMATPAWNALQAPGEPQRDATPLLD